MAGTRAATGIGLLAGVAASALGATAAGYGLEERLVTKRRRADRRLPPEPFFSLRSTGPDVATGDGLRLHTEIDEAAPGESGDSPDGQTQPVTVVFVHGYALTLDCWHFQRAHFRNRHRLIFYDHRSHGRSERSASSLCRLPQLADDLARVVREAAGAGPIVLVGHSMGALTIMELARQHPDWFTTGGVPGAVGPVVGTGLLFTAADDLLDRHPIRGLPGRVGAHLAQPAMAGLNRFPGAVDRARRTGSDLAFVATRWLGYGSQVPGSYVSFVDTMLAGTSLQVIADYYPAFGKLDELDVLPLLDRLPCLIAGGRQDVITPIRHTEAIAARMPSAEALLLDRCGHLGMIEHHETVNAGLDNLIRDAQRAALGPRPTMGRR